MAGRDPMADSPIPRRRSERFYSPDQIDGGVERFALLGGPSLNHHCHGIHRGLSTPTAERRGREAVEAPMRRSTLRTRRLFLGAEAALLPLELDDVRTPGGLLVDVDEQIHS